MEKTKAFNIRLPKNLWEFLRKRSTDKEKSMNAILMELIEKHKNRVEKRVDAA